MRDEFSAMQVGGRLDFAVPCQCGAWQFSQLSMADTKVNARKSRDGPGLPVWNGDGTMLPPRRGGGIQLMLVEQLGPCDK